MQTSSEEISAVASVAIPQSERYEPFAGTYKVVPRQRLRAAGWRVTRSMRPVTYCVPDTWIDIETGELLTRAEAKKRGIVLPAARSISDKMLNTLDCLASCTASERPFVQFLLSMRNHRGGLIAPLGDLLDQWIDCECSGIRSTNRARKRKQLRAIIQRRQVMTNDTTMARNLMMLNPNMTKQDLLEEGAKRYNGHHRPKNGGCAIFPKGKALLHTVHSVPAYNHTFASEQLAKRGEKT